MRLLSRLIVTAATAVSLATLSTSALGHHNPVVYNGKVTVKISGTVRAAHFGFPHSRYALDVTDESGNTERWLVMTEDPRDAEILGFADELKAIEVGQTLTVVGWPNKIKEREIRGHQLHYPDGTVVMMRRGNYIWTNDLRRIWRLWDGQIEFPEDVNSIPADTPAGERVAKWIREGDPVARVAREIDDGSAALISIDSGAGGEVAGVREPFLCHTQREDFVLPVSLVDVSSADRAVIDAGGDYIERYNDLLATYWEYDIASCD